jgi:hypothetical protein
MTGLDPIISSALNRCSATLRPVIAGAARQSLAAGDREIASLRSQYRGGKAGSCFSGSSYWRRRAGSRGRVRPIHDGIATYAIMTPVVVRSCRSR